MPYVVSWLLFQHFYFLFKSYFNPFVILYLYIGNVVSKNKRLTKTVYYIWNESNLLQTNGFFILLNATTGVDKNEL